ncbi:cytochrome c oxidase, subunit II [Thermocrinis albus DSM 14484]|uniref:Cytochrome c oxidase subunit 2 n=1 Tax=Thermocrinis albus (strain DSM 14484 / JCM 11386 / HI 11/12) TaxID=638303 RepID=D3SN05_THEAH|nr:cytochrome c oxidase subunit II [Thermocrinis albus]ADC90135.1 cytochrome c oxidase, subunit II [Thermocrinis albus DSM 14484]
MRKSALLTLFTASCALAAPVAEPARYWYNMYYIWLVVAVAIYLIVVIPAIYFAVKYRYRKGNETAQHVQENHLLEILWTIVPVLIVIYLATQSFAFYRVQRNAPEGAFEIKVTGFMWGWQFQYPNGKQVIAFFNMMEDPQTKEYLPLDKIPDTAKAYIPAGVPIKVLLTSQDVIHSFYVHPAKVMEDAVPGRITHLWFQINQPGEYWVFCREYCGTKHSKMAAVLKVVPKEEFEKWYGGPLPIQGKQVSFNIQ